MLLLFLGLNMLPPQVLITPLYQIFRRQPDLLYDQYLGIAIVHIAFQLGFCTFVLSNYMKTLPKELNEAALVDGASVWKTFYRDHHAAHPSCPGSARGAAGHVDLQRLLLGARS